MQHKLKVELREEGRIAKIELDDRPLTVTKLNMNLRCDQFYAATIELYADQHIEIDKCDVDLFATIQGRRYRLQDVELEEAESSKRITRKREWMDLREATRHLVDVHASSLSSDSRDSLIDELVGAIKTWK